MFNTGNEQNCGLAIFVSSVSRRFGLVSRFVYAMKENIKKNFVVRALKTNQVCNVVFFFFAAWLPGKSDLGKVLKWRKIKRPLKLCI